MKRRTLEGYITLVIITILLLLGGQALYKAVGTVQAAQAVHDNLINAIGE